MGVVCGGGLCVLSVVVAYGDGVSGSFWKNEPLTPSP